jgi:hypothetical protein
MEIKPTYATFEQSKKLKKKGFDLLNCKSGYHGDFGDLEDDEYPFLGTYTFLDNVLIRNNAEWKIQRPEHWQVIEWALKNYNIWISVQPNEPFTDNDWCFKIFKNNQLIMSLEGYDSPKNAYIEAINKFLKMI